MNNVTIYIPNHLKGQITPRDLMLASATLIVVDNYANLIGRSGLLFRLNSPKYCLESGFADGYIYVARNQDTHRVQLQPVFEPTGNVIIYVGWEPTQLTLQVVDSSYGQYASSLPDPLEHEQAIEHEFEIRRAVCKTTLTIPPNSLIAWARKNDIVPVATYDSPHEFNTTVTSSLQSLSDKVTTLGMHSSFWDITYDGLQIVERWPKHEPHIGPILHGLLFDIATAKNLQVTPEYHIAGGKLDFLFSGPLKTGQIASVCVEFKHAHSDDLINGIKKQLPAYMHAKGCDFGIYCVLYFKGDYFNKPKNFDFDKMELFFASHGAFPLPNIRLLKLDLSHPKTPSKL